LREEGSLRGGLMEDQSKKVDEKWKEVAQKEKDNPSPKGGIDVPEATFAFFVTTLAIQATIFLGVMPDPATQKKEENLPQAKFIIDTLGMLKDKTQNNLDAQEQQHLDQILYELRMQYLSKAQIVK
jgi:hypothetical protein